ncbi:hypothetical protein B0H13DRAFT_1513107, partial [Mycena leptocephala]
LPFEITAEIFAHFLPVCPLCSPPVGQGSPTLFGQVCRQWQDIAIASPQLWRSLKLELIPKSLPQQLKFFRKWLARSGACPL